MAKTTKQRNPETAAQAYTRLSKDINEQVKNLEFRLQIHAGSHRDRPADWGYPGDLGHVKELLGELLGFLGGGR